MQTLKDLITTSFAFANMADDEKNKMIEELSGIAIQRTVIRALDKMNEDEVKDWQKTMADDANPAKVFAYLEAHVPSFYDMLREEVMRLVDLAAEEGIK